MFFTVEALSLRIKKKFFLIRPFLTELCENLTEITYEIILLTSVLLGTKNSSPSYNILTHFYLFEIPKHTHNQKVEIT